MNHAASFVLLAFVSALHPSFIWAGPDVPVPSPTPPPVESGSNTRTAGKGLTLPEVVVSVSRLDTPVSQVANSVSVITAKEIEQKQADTVLDALEGVPGLTLLQNGSPGQNSDLFIRGADAGHTLVLMDGIPLNNPITTDRQFGGLDQLFLEDVGRIEVVRGPLSMVYGTDATAGVVDIIPQRAGGTPKGSLMFEGGAYGTFHEAATASAGNDWGDLSLSLSRFDTAGFPSADKSFGNTLDNRDGNTTASLRFGAYPLANLQNSLFVRYDQSLTSLDAQGGADGDDPNYFLRERQWVAGSRTQWDLWGGAWEQVLGISYTDDLQEFTDDFSAYPNSHYERGAFEGQAAQLTWQNNFHPWKEETLVAGFQGRRDWGREDDTTDYGYGLSDALINRSTSTGGYFLESQTSLWGRLFAILGGRLDEVSSFGGQFTYRGALAYFIPGWETKVKVSYGTGFKAPSIYQLYSPYGNQDLSAENSRGWDAGFEQPLGAGTVRVGASYFHDDFSNLIDFESTAAPPYGRYFNVDAARTEGWEAFASVHPLRELVLKAQYTYTWALDLQTDSPLLRRPQNQADFNAFFEKDGAGLGLEVLYVGDRADENFATYPASPVTLPPYWLVNLRASFEISPQVKFFGRVDNLLNASYEEIYGYGTPGLSVYMGTKVSL
jgi:vitamin B12 transporter